MGEPSRIMDSRAAVYNAKKYRLPFYWYPEYRPGSGESVPRSSSIILNARRTQLKSDDYGRIVSCAKQPPGIFSNNRCMVASNPRKSSGLVR